MGWGGVGWGGDLVGEGPAVLLVAALSLEHGGGLEADHKLVWNVQEPGPHLAQGADLETTSDSRSLTVAAFRIGVLGKVSILL